MPNDSTPAIAVPSASPRPAETAPAAASRADERFHACPIDPDCPYCQGQARAEDAPDWSFAEAVYCISLIDRDDRAALAAREFHKAGLCRRVLFYRPVRHPTRVIEGIWESHRAVGRHALDRGVRTALIFEDDVAFTRRIDRARTARIADAVRRLPPDWTLFFLGHWPLKARFVAPDILATSSACAHAYLASPRLLDWLAANPFSKTARDRARIVGGSIDAAYARLDGSYAYFPMLAVQAVRGSDHMAQKKGRRRITKLKHLVTRTDLGEHMLCRLMRPNEVVIAGLGAVAGLGERVMARVGFGRVSPTQGRRPWP